MVFIISLFLSYIPLKSTFGSIFKEIKICFYLFLSIYTLFIIGSVTYIYKLKLQLSNNLKYEMQRSFKKDCIYTHLKKNIAHCAKYRNFT